MSIFEIAAWMKLRPFVVTVNRLEMKSVAPFPADSICFALSSQWNSNMQRIVINNRRFPILTVFQLKETDTF
jgi:hypothetical protein